MDEEIITCWCGAKGTYDQLFADDFGDGCCGGSGTLDCECGGDQCVCHNHGQVECPGCPDCEQEDECEDDDDWEVLAAPEENDPSGLTPDEY